MDLDAIKAATWALHTKAERSGIIADIIAGRANQYGVALLWRNLLPVYQALDRSAFGHPALARSDAIEADLRLLAPGVDVPLLPEAAAYADRVRAAGDGLVAHAYVRYLGDLNGGRIMKHRLAACLGVMAAKVTFHDYPALADPGAFVRSYRSALDLAVQAVPHELAAGEALVAFEMNIALSQAVKTMVEQL